MRGCYGSCEESCYKLTGGNHGEDLLLLTLYGARVQHQILDGCLEKVSESERDVEQLAFSTGIMLPFKGDNIGSL